MGGRRFRPFGHRPRLTRFGRPSGISSTSRRCWPLWCSGGRAGAWCLLQWRSRPAAVTLDRLRSGMLLEGCAVAPAAAVVVWLTVRSPALTDKEATLREAARAGHRLTAAIAVLAAVSAVAVFGAQRLRPGDWRL